VEAEVDDGVPLGAPHPVVQRVAHRAAAVLDREVHDARRAAERRRDRPRLEVVGGRRAAERHVEVRVDVDAAGDHVLPDASIVRSAWKRCAGRSLPMAVIVPFSQYTSAT
jgi:hypothetical protein